MNPDLEHLIVLQAQDLDLARLRTELTSAPRYVKDAEAALLSAEKAHAAVRSALAEEERLRRGQESEIGTQRSKITRLRRSLDAATNTAQVAAFEHEIGFAASAVSRLEDEELASMERTETLEAEETRAAALVAQRRQHLDAERLRVTQLTADHKAQIEGIEQQRRELRSQITDTVLATYDRLTKAKGTAIAEALGNATQGKCAACQMAVRPQRWQDLIGREHEDEIFICDTCGRMLFWDPRRDTPKPWEPGDRLRRAQAGSPR